MKSVIMCTLLLCICSFSISAKRVPISNLAKIKVKSRYDGTRLTHEEVAKAIERGCAVKQWKTEQISDNEIKATILVRGKHYVALRIPYSEEEFSIMFLDAKKMDYSEKRRLIHSNYEKWINNLMRAILQEINAPR